MSTRALTVPENLSLAGGFHPGGSEGSNTESFKMLNRHSSDAHLSGRNVVLNYGQTNTFYDRHHLVRRNSRGNKENQVPVVIGSGLPPPPPPELSEETLMSPEHNEILSKLRFVSLLVDTIIEVARHKAAPLSAITESAVRTQGGSSANLGNIDVTSPQHRRLQQVKTLFSLVNPKYLKLLHPSNLVSIFFNDSF